MPAGSRNVRLTGTSGTLRADPSFLTGGTTTAKLDYTNRAVWQGQIDAMRFWLAEHGVDGFRCDMAMLVPIEFWQEAARRLRAVKPDLFLLAEAEEDYLFDRLSTRRMPGGFIT